LDSVVQEVLYGRNSKKASLKFVMEGEKRKSGDNLKNFDFPSMQMARIILK
jgi:hypothetical protein